MTGLSPRGFLSLTAALPLRVVVGRAAAERLGSEIGIEDRGALPDNSHPERSEGSRYTPIVNHLSINTSRRGGAFLYSRRGLRLWRRGAYGIHRACRPEGPLPLERSEHNPPPIGGHNPRGAASSTLTPDRACPMNLLNSGHREDHQNTTGNSGPSVA